MSNNLISIKMNLSIFCRNNMHNFIERTYTYFSWDNHRKRKERKKILQEKCKHLTELNMVSFSLSSFIKSAR